MQTIHRIGKKINSPGNEEITIESLSLKSRSPRDELIRPTFYQICMSNDSTDIDLIERYLLGKLSGAELGNVEARLDDDREFARKYRMIKMFPEMMSEAGRRELEQKRAEAAAPAVKKKAVKRPALLEEKKAEQKKSPRLPKRRIFLWGGIVIIAASCIVLLFIYTGRNQPKADVIKEENAGRVAGIINKEVVPVKDSTIVKNEQPEKPEPPAVVGENLGKAIALISPADGMTFFKKDSIRFSWAQKTDSFTRFYIVSDLHNQVVYWRGVRLGVRAYKVPANYLFPGKYYWYVGTKEEKRSFLVSAEKP